MTTFSDNGYDFNRQVSSLSGLARSLAHLLRQGAKVPGNMDPIGFSDEDLATLNAASGALDRLAAEAEVEKARRFQLLQDTPIETAEFGPLYRTHRYSIKHDMNRWGGSPTPRWAKDVRIDVWHEPQGTRDFVMATIVYRSGRRLDIRRISAVIDLTPSASIEPSSPSSSA